MAARTVLVWWECLREILSPGLGETPAETGVVGLVVGRGDGRGREDVLSLASRDFISRAEGLVVPPTGVLDLTGMAKADGSGATRVGFGEESLERFGSGALKVRPASRVRRDRDFVAVTVCALVGLGISLASRARSTIG